MKIKELSNKLKSNISKVIKGKEHETELFLCAFSQEVECFSEDVPGTGKTTLATVLAASVELDVKRIQFIPDLLLADITGVYFFNMKTREFTFHPYSPTLLQQTRYSRTQ